MCINVCKFKVDPNKHWMVSLKVYFLAVFKVVPFQQEPIGAPDCKVKFAGVLRDRLAHWWFCFLSWDLLTIRKIKQHQPCSLNCVPGSCNTLLDYMHTSVLVMIRSLSILFVFTLNIMFCFQKHGQAFIPVLRILKMPINASEAGILQHVHTLSAMCADAASMDVCRSC